MKTKRLAADALCAALYVLLSSYASVSLVNMKLSFDGAALLIGALLFGPVDGLIIGALGSFLGQLLGPYGLSVTTPLWMLPAMARGLMVGLWARQRGGRYDRRALAGILVVSALVVTAVTTGVMWVDSRVFAYPFAATLPSVLLRVAAGLITSAIYTLILPPIVRALRKSGWAESEDI